jgi:2-phospho-L-lactate/phosphoenolpyruvate guanylyltransferase
MRGDSMHHDVSTSLDAGFVVPIRAFADAKARLAPRLDRATRSALVQRLAETVLRAAQPWPVVVVTSAPEVREWAAARALPCIDDPGTLDDAAARGRAWVAAEGFSRVAVVHADLPFARSLTEVARGGNAPVAALVPCHRDDGTPVLAVPVAAPFRFRYGPGSFARHVDEARRCGLEVRVVRDPDLRFDVDVPDDLDQLALGRGPTALPTGPPGRRRLRPATRRAV